MAESDAEHTPPQAITMNSEELLASRMAIKLLEIVPGDKIVEPPSIYRVLPYIRAEDNGAYYPKIISIGPFHRNNKELLPMQQLKWLFLHDLIQRSSTNSLDIYIKKAWKLQSRARNCYSGEVGPEGGEFVEMLVLDGCFIIEFLVKWIQQEKDGPLYAVHWILPHLRNDLLLLENQLPFFVLQSLFDASDIPYLDNFKANLEKDTLTWLALTYLTRGEMDNLSTPNDVSHLLQLFHFTLRPTIDGQDDKSDTATCFKCVMILTRKIKHVLLYSFYWCLSLILYCRRPPGRDACIRAPRMIPSATELQEAGVQFKAKKKARGFLDVTFEDGVLEMPMLPVQSATIPLFRNLVAFEQCTPGSGSDFTSYVALMDNLIDTSDDVLVLEGCGILESKLGGEEEVTKFFNSLRMGTYLEYDNHYLVDLFTEVKEYSADESHQWRAMLVHDYFGNPWSVVSLIAAIVLRYFDSPTENAPTFLRASEICLCAIHKREVAISKVSLCENCLCAIQKMELAISVVSLLVEET